MRRAVTCRKAPLAAVLSAVLAAPLAASLACAKTDDGPGLRRHVVFHVKANGPGVGDFPAVLILMPVRGPAA